MRRLITVLLTLTVALGFSMAAVAPAEAALTSPANGAVLRGSATIADTGGYDDSSLSHCGWFGGSGGSTRLQLINSGGTILINEYWNTGGARSHTFDTHAFPNGTYTVRGIIEIRRNSGFLGLGCKTDTETSTRSVTIDNITSLAYEGATSAPRNTTIPVSATLTDPNKSPQGVGGQTVTFALSGSGSVTGTTNANGVATANLPVTGSAGSRTLTVSYPNTTFWKGSTATVPFTVNKNSTSTTVADPASVVHGQAVTFSATVARDNGSSGVPSGTVQFKVDGSNLGDPVPVTGGVAVSTAVDDLSTGEHSVTAAYNGDADFLTSTSAPKTVVVAKAPTSTVLTGPGSPTVTGQAVTFTAKVDVVLPGVGQPVGSVQFNIDGQPFGTAVPLSGDTAQLTVSNLSPGNHDVVANYNGNADFASSSSNPVTHGVNRADTSISLASSNPDAVSGEPLTYTAEVAPVGPGAGTPTGTVQFTVDGEPLGDPVTVTNGTAVSEVVKLPVRFGGHHISADYSGDSNFAGATKSLTQNIAMAATSTTVMSSPNPSVVGQPVTIRATVDPVAPATGTPQGAVRFLVDGVTVDLVDLQAGAAELQISSLGRGSHDIQTRYLSEDPNFATSSSPIISHQVNKAATQTIVESSATPSVFGQPVTFTATVSVVAPGAGAPSGEVTFTDGATPIGTVPVDASTNFRATLTTSSLSVAQHAITATYSGDDSFLGSNGTVVQKVNRAQTSTVVVSSSNPAQSGEGVNFTATVSPVAPGAGNPTGTVRFSVNGANLGQPVQVVGGVATSTAFASLAPGTYDIQAAYSGDGNFVDSSGGLDQGNGLNVVKGATEMTLSASPAMPEFGEAVTFTSTVKAVAPATGRPTGVVQVWEGDVLLGATSLAPAGPGTSQAVFVSSTMTPGAHAIRAVYVGNFNFNAQTASTSLSVGQSGTTTGLVSSANPSTFGESVTLTAVVTDAPGSTASPTGTVTFTEGDAVLATAAVSTVGGRQEASVDISTLSGGTHQIKARYSGDATHSASTSAAHTQVVNRAQSHIDAPQLVTSMPFDMTLMHATLTGVDGVPLAGQTLAFTTRPIPEVHHHTCYGVTGSDGKAFCNEPLQLVPLVVDGYVVTFAGNDDYLPAEDHGTVFAEDS